MAGVCFWEEVIETGPVPKEMSSFDAIIVGGGPGGCATAGYLAKAGKKVLLIEKGIWPRDKVCGDAIGGKSLNHVRDLGVKVVLETTPYFKVTGITFSSPSGKSVTVPLPEEEMGKMEAGYALPRQQFDWLMFKSCSEHVLASDGFVIQGAEVRETIRKGDSIVGVKVRIGGRDGTLLDFFSKWTIGAGGYNCPIARSVIKDIHGQELFDKKHYCGGYREYWQGVKGCGGDVGNIEIHFVDSVKSGYFWLFPLGGGMVNVGIGMILDILDKQKTKLKKLQKNVIQNHPLFKDRFVDAVMVEGSGKGWQLPFGSPRKKEKLQPRRMFSDGVLLVGDAASLVDPFSGEGVGNALVSGHIAARHVVENIGGIVYQNEIWDLLGPELTNSFKMQKMSKKGWLLNWFVGKASKKPQLQKMMTEMIASKEAQENLHSKWFLIKTFLF